MDEHSSDQAPRTTTKETSFLQRAVTKVRWAAAVTILCTTGVVALEQVKYGPLNLGAVNWASNLIASRLNPKAATSETISESLLPPGNKTLISWVLNNFKDHGLPLSYTAMDQGALPTFQQLEQFLTSNPASEKKAIETLKSFNKPALYFFAVRRNVDEIGESLLNSNQTHTKEGNKKIVHSTFNFYHKIIDGTEKQGLLLKTEQAFESLPEATQLLLTHFTDKDFVFHTVSNLSTLEIIKSIKNLPPEQQIFILELIKNNADADTFADLQKTLSALTTLSNWLENNKNPNSSYLKADHTVQNGEMLYNLFILPQLKKDQIADEMTLRQIYILSNPKNFQGVTDYWTKKLGESFDPTQVLILSASVISDAVILDPQVGIETFNSNDKFTAWLEVHPTYGLEDALPYLNYVTAATYPSSSGNLPRFLSQPEIKIVADLMQKHPKILPPGRLLLLLQTNNGNAQGVDLALTYLEKLLPNIEEAINQPDLVSKVVNRSIMQTESELEFPDDYKKAGLPIEPLIESDGVWKIPIESAVFELRTREMSKHSGSTQILVPLILNYEQDSFVSWTQENGSIVTPDLMLSSRIEELKTIIPTLDFLFTKPGAPLEYRKLNENEIAHFTSAQELIDIVQKEGYSGFSRVLPALDSDGNLSADFFIQRANSQDTLNLLLILPPSDLIHPSEASLITIPVGGLNQSTIDNLKEKYPNSKIQILLQDASTQSRAYTQTRPEGIVATPGNSPQVGLIFTVKK